MSREGDGTRLSGFGATVAGTTAGAVTCIIFHPLSVMQTRFQVSSKAGPSVVAFQYSSVKDALRTMLREEGWQSLYQGLSPAVLGNGVSWGLYFLFYNNAKKQWAAQLTDSGQVASLGPLANAACATVAGWSTSICTNPIWVIKTRMQIQTRSGTGNYTGLLHAFRTVWTEEGIRGLYRGLVPSFFGVTHGAIQLPVYEELNKLASSKYNNGAPVTFKQSLVTGALSKICASTVTYPYQVVKSRMQIRPLVPGAPPPYNGVRDTLAKTWRYEGIAGFYRGCFLNLLRVTPNSAVTLALYELIAKQFRS